MIWLVSVSRSECSNETLSNGCNWCMSWFWRILKQKYGRTINIYQSFYNQPSAGEGKIIMFNPQNTHNQSSAGGDQIIIFFGKIKTYKTSLQASKVC